MKVIAKKLSISDFTALIFLIVMASFLSYAALHDSNTMDEAAHTPAGYSYVLKKDMRLNPEHPPLVKTLAGIPILLLQNVNFPEKHPSWQEAVNGQWDFGFNFLYHVGNDAEKIIHAARIAPIALSLILGWFIFIFGKYLLGPGWALLALFFYVFSPNFLAHGHLVTTDIAATLGIVVAAYFFIQFLNRPSPKNIIVGGLALGTALLLKFTTFLIIPVFIAVLVLISFLTRTSLVRSLIPIPKTALLGAWLQAFLFWFSRLFLIGIIALSVVTLVYMFHVWNYPPERHFRDADFILRSYGFRPLVNFDLALIKGALPFRAFGQYLLGLIMNMQRSAGGHTTYFLGEISASGRWYYFPLVYILKEPIPLLFLIFFAAILALRKTVSLVDNIRRGVLGFSLRAHLQAHITEITMLLFVVGYWLASIISNLNIGVRHIFPTLPFIYILTMQQIKNWIFPPVTIKAGAFLAQLFYWLKFSIKTTSKIVVMTFLMFWYFMEFVAVTPNFLAYFNEFIGGPPHAYKIVTDSNLDWGQDLKRLRDFVAKNNIPKIKVDYFGGGDARYYLGERFEPMNSRIPNQKGWVAISASFLQSGRGEPTPGQKGDYGYYRWLDQYEPVAKIGYSIFVYYIPE